MIFYDFEVFWYDWLVVLIDLNARKETVIINDPDKLKRFYEEHKGVIWAGYNSRNYDQYILKAILCGFDPKPVNDWIIAENKPGYRYSSLFREYPLINYDVMPNPPISLKALEAFMGHSINPVDVIKQAAMEAQESSKPVNILFGTVLSASPLKIQVDQKSIYTSKMLILTRNVTDFEVDMTVNHTTEDKGGGSGAAAYEAHKHAYVGKKTFKVHNALKAGEKVLLIRVQQGKKFVVIDRVKGA